MINPDARFWNRIARRYARKPVPDEAVYAQKLEVSRGYFPASAEVLEVGCGTGTTALHHAPDVQHLRALDFSQPMIDIAEEKRVAAGVTNVSFECVGSDALAGDDAQYDVVLAHSVLHLITDWRVTIKRIHSLLRPGGVFISSTACIADDMAWLRYVLPLGHAVGLLPRVAVFTSGELKAALDEAGFSIEHEWQPGKNRGLFIVARRE